MKGLIVIFFSLIFWGCASKFIEQKKVEEIKKNQEFSQLVKIKELPNKPSQSTPPPQKVEAKRKKAKKRKKIAKMKKNKNTQTPKKVISKKKSEETVQISKPFPFRIGEKVVLSVNYFKVSAGTITFEVLPFASVNGRKAYHFVARVKSNKVFSFFYKVDDWAETYVDQDTFLPLAFNVHVNESQHAKEIKMYLDHKNLKGTYWEKKIDKKGKKESKKKVWDIKPRAQDALSVLFYLRSQDLKVGKTIHTFIADDGKNVIFTGKVLRKEALKTDLGTFQTLVVKPEFKVEGVFKPIGDIYFWFTDDDYKQLVRFEAKIKIGTLVGELVEKK
ncbi:MAG: DUF3108 domain-containing protein [Bdellovibrio sp.]|nr:MAG: DUF3108 domain-containing protein [Bdellovibrio sp.]